MRVGVGRAGHLRVAFAWRGALLAERARWILWLPVAVGVGAGIYFALPAEPPNWLGAVLLLSTVLGAFGLRRRTSLLLLSIGLAGVATGFAAGQLRTNLTAAPVLEKRIGSAMVTGRIVLVQSRGTAQRWLMDDLSISRLAPGDTPERIRLTNRVRGVALEPGMRIRVRATLMPPPSPAAPGAFDFPRLAWFASLGAVGFTTSRAQVVGVEDREFSTSLSALRQGMSARVRTALPGASGAVAAALMTGDRGAIPEDVLADMRDSGLAHLLAISGLHVGLVAGLFFFFVRGLLAAIEPVALRYPIKKWAAAGAMVAAFAYLLITGATVPTQRAFIMTAIVLTAIMLDRSAVSMRIVALAALAILILAPETLLSASFQMSFAAVVALVAVYESAGARFSRGRGRGSLRRRFLIYGAGILLTSLVAGLATTPFAVFHFNRFVVYGLAANMFAVPLTALWIMPWAMVAYVLMPFGLEGLVLAPMGAGIDAMLWIARTAAAWPGAVQLLPALPGWGLVLITLGGLWLFLWRRVWRYAGVAAIVGGGLALATTHPPDILIDGDAKQVAVRGQGGGLSVSGRATSFVAETWLRRAGIASATRWPRGSDRRAPHEQGGLRCDGLGCVATIDGRTVAIAFSRGALADDCRTADIIVSFVPVRGPCPSAHLVVDRFDVWRSGAHAIWLSGGEIRVETASGQRGRRPWVETHRRVRALEKRLAAKP